MYIYIYIYIHVCMSIYIYISILLLLLLLIIIILTIIIIIITIVIIMIIIITIMIIIIIVIIIIPPLLRLCGVRLDGARVAERLVCHLVHVGHRVVLRHAVVSDDLGRALHDAEQERQGEDAERREREARAAHHREGDHELREGHRKGLGRAIQGALHLVHVVVEPRRQVADRALLEEGLLLLQQVPEDLLPHRHGHVPARQREEDAYATNIYTPPPINVCSV